MLADVVSPLFITNTHTHTHTVSSGCSVIGAIYNSTTKSVNWIRQPSIIEQTVKLAPAMIKK